MLGGLSKRQQVLFERLLTLGEWANNGDLPMELLEIRGFGSFFRGAPSPKDMDLFIRCQRVPIRTEFERFLQLLNRIRYKPFLEEQFDTPKLALLELARETDASDRERELFGEWLEGYSWHMLHPRTIAQQVEFESPVGFTRRMISRRLPKLSIVRFQGAQEDIPRAGIRCGFTVLIWLLQTHRQQPTGEPDWNWLEKWSEKQESLRALRDRFQSAEAHANRFDDEQWGKLDLPSSIRVLPFEQALRRADDLRRQLKELYLSIDAFEELRLHLAEYHSGNAITDLPAKEYAVTAMLETGSAKQRAMKTDFLKQLDLLS